MMSSEVIVLKYCPLPHTMRSAILDRFGSDVATVSCEGKRCENMGSMSMELGSVE